MSDAPTNPPTARERMLEALWNATVQNPLGHHRVYLPDGVQPHEPEPRAALIRVYPFDGGVHLSELIVIPPARRGAGKATMDMLCRLADEYGVKLTCSPKRIGPTGMRTAALRAWYRRWGFRPGRYYNPMTRLPREIKTPPASNPNELTQTS